MEKEADIFAGKELWIRVDQVTPTHSLEKWEDKGGVYKEGEEKGGGEGQQERWRDKEERKKGGWKEKEEKEKEKEEERKNS